MKKEEDYGSVKRIFHSKLIWQLTVISLASTLTASLIMGVIVYRYTTKKANENAKEVARELLQQYDKKIDYSIDELERMSFNVLLNEDIKYMLGGMKNPYERVALQQKLTHDLRGYANYRNDIIGIYLYAMDGQKYYSDMSRSLREDYSILQEDWYWEKVGDQRKFALCYQKEDSQFLIPTRKDMICLVRNLFDFSNEKYGVLEIDIRTDILEDSFGENMDNNYYQFLILDADRQPVYYKGSESILHESIQQALALIQEQTEDTELNLQYGGNQWSLCTHTSEYTGWTYACVINLDYLLLEGNLLLYMLIRIFLLSAVFAIAFSLFAGYLIFQPLRNLQNSMKQIGEGNTKKRVLIYRDDEIGELTERFNTMLDDLNRNMERNIQLEQEKSRLEILSRQVELDALQSQINPHFLYNALENISMAARIQNDFKAQRLAIVLGRLLRLSILTAERLVPLEEELRHVSCYTEFLQLHSENAVAVEFHVPEEYRNYRILKLILQPVIENCVNHGFQNSCQGGEIHIYGRLEGQILYLDVIDNGCGMEKAVMEQLNQNFASEELTYSGSIGLPNTNMRIRLQYGDVKYGLHIVKSDSQGTHVRIAVPVSQ